MAKNQQVGRFLQTSNSLRADNNNNTTHLWDQSCGVARAREGKRTYVLSIYNSWL